MWLKLFLLTLVALACADHNPGWRHNHVYVYEIRGRIVTSLNQISNNYSGILLKAKLRIVPRPDGHLGAEISSAQYANLHSKLPHSWVEQIADSQLSYEELPLSPKPFKILMDNGVVKDIVVNKDITNWEANMIKGIVSQLQLDTEAENQLQSSINLFTQEQNNAVFKTMEQTVTGECETLYEIHPLPEHVLQTKPWLGPHRELNKGENWIEVVKTKNFTQAQENLGYYFRLHGVDNFDIKNQIGEFFTRSSISRAVLSGSLRSYTLQHVATVDQIYINPTLHDKQKGSTQTTLNITLESLQQEQRQLEEVSNPVNIGVVYRYDQPFGESNQPEPRMLGQTRDGTFSSIFPASGEEIEEEYRRVQEQPHIQKAPASPLLPFTVGFDGQVISKKQNIKETVRLLAKKIGQEFLQPEDIPKENTVGKFLILTSLLRVMDHQEIKYVAEKLYTSEKHGEAATAWVAFRDALAQAGTGPALLCIEECIRSGRIVENEAAEVIATAAAAARQPTEKYMKVFFGLLQNEKNINEKYLNESLLLSYTKLVRQVYVSKDVSHDKYPVHSFGTFNTVQGRLFVEKEVIPFLAAKLHKAVSKADTVQIHVLIRALGNLAHREVLSVFKPYLEGTKKVSQFQRVLMVIALDELVNYDPLVARSVLYRLYQNGKEFEQVRVAAVFQLMHTRPSPAMLQKMALHTNFDSNNHVNSAVKSYIENACKITSPDHADLRTAAESAKPLLSSRDFGAQNSKQNFKLYIVDEMKQLGITEIFENYSGEDSVVPKGFHYFLRASLGGYKQPIIDVQSMVSSIEDLVNVFEQQTKQYKRLLREKQAYESVKTKWSSEHTAKLLNMQNEQREQLESYLYLQFHSLEKVWSFDNHTVDNLTEIVKELEAEFRNGKHVHYNKMAVYPEMVIALPTDLGLPFIYTYDRPSLVHFESDVKAEAQPSLYSREGIQTPEKIDVEFKVQGFVSIKDQSQLGFFAPFNHKRYSAGYDTNVQVQIPALTGKAHLDIENKQVTLEVEYADTKTVPKLVHISTWPYTSQNEIYNTKPVNQIIRKQQQQRINTVLGEKHTGLAFDFKMVSDEKLDYAFFYEKCRNKKLGSALLTPWLSDEIQHFEMDLTLDSSRSTTRKVVLHLGHQRRFLPGNSALRITENIKSSLQVPQESWERQKQILKNTVEGITHVRARVVDAIALFEGQRTIKYSATLAGASSNIDPKGRMIFQTEKDNQQEEPVKVQITANTKMHNPPSLNVESALEFDPTTTVELKATIEQKSKSPAQVGVKVKLEKSESRKQYLKELPVYKKCQHEMKDGNHQLHSCAHLTTQANLLDKFSLSLEYNDLDKAILNHTYKVYSILRHHLYPRVSENILVDNNSPADRNKVEIRGHFNPSLTSLNASIDVGKYGRVEFSNVEVNPFLRHLLVHHPAYPVHTRVAGHVLNYQTYQPICVVDKTAVNTLDNRTYPVTLENDWVVLLHYVPRRPSPNQNKPYLTVSEQLNQMIEGYIVYTRANSDKKEIKLVIQSQNTLSKVIDITLKPSQSGYPKLYVQNEEIKYDDQGTHMYDDYMQVYKLPNDEMKVSIYDAFEVIYDGSRAKIVLTNDKFRDASRGLCGTFTGEKETDFTHPGNCIIQNPEVFVATNTVPEQQRTKRMNDMLMIQAEEKKCYQKSVGYVTVVSNQDLAKPLMVGLSNSMKYMTKYIEVEGLTCFSVRPVPVCRSGYIQRSHSRSVEVHCVQASNVADLWKKQIDNGASPDLSNKAAHKSVMMPVAQSCEM